MGRSSKEAATIGPKILWEGAGVKTDVDIIFVHGLRGHRENTWSTGDFCWPRDLLPNDLDTSRIISWGYDANVADFLSSSSQASMHAHATALLEDISMEREENVCLYWFHT